MHTNSLITEKSPYLLQHAHNPVDWLAWGEAAFEKARAEDKPVFLSVGYSTCHWCHVMERESFESEETAAVLNRYFVPVKVDREERPDLDRVYMAFVQATTGSGGWPMSVWLTPDARPFYGGTYFPPDNRYGRPGFRTLLEHIAQVWMTDRARILQSSADTLAELKKHTEVRSGSIPVPAAGVADSCFQVFRRSYDSRLGGWGQAPKFPRPVANNFLLRHFAWTGNTEARDMVLHTLGEMAKGGMYDQIGGGFHRYSVDDRWFVPHFEKMLYDQAQLAVSYLEAYQITRDATFARVARDIFDYVLRDLTHPEGAFYSAEDADSVIDPAHPHEKGEGAFYIWSRAELEGVLGLPLADWFCHRYGVESDGNVAHDPQNEFRGRNILYQRSPAAETARRFGVEEAAFDEAMGAARIKLMKERSKRIRPHLDDKILTGWNGLMISAFALGAQALCEPAYAAVARRAADFVLGRMRSPELLRRFRDGEAAIPAFLDDYAFFANALVDLYETVFDPRYLGEAIGLAAEMIERFHDSEHGGFFSTPANGEKLILRMKDDYDGAEPAGNSMAVWLLLRLGAMTGREDFRQAANRTLEAFSSRLRSVPHAIPQMAVAAVAAVSTPRQIVLAGDPDGAGFQALQAEAGRHFMPYRVLMRAGSELLPATGPMVPLDGRATAYVCENFACKLPVTRREQLAELLQ